MISSTTSYGLNRRAIATSSASSAGRSWSMKSRWNIRCWSKATSKQSWLQRSLPQSRDSSQWLEPWEKCASSGMRSASKTHTSLGRKKEKTWNWLSREIRRSLSVTTKTSQRMERRSSSTKKFRDNNWWSTRSLRSMMRRKTQKKGTTLFHRWRSSKPTCTCSLSKSPASRGRSKIFQKIISSSQRNSRN